MRTLALCLLLTVPGALTAQAYTVSAGSKTYADLAGGNSLSIGNEQLTGEIKPAGFAFSYFSQVYAGFKVCDNGFLILGANGTETGTIPNHASNWPGPTIAPLWTNAKTGTGLANPAADRIAWDFAGGVLTVEWRWLETDPNPSATRWDPSALRMKAMLDQNTGIIEFNYGDPTNPPNQAILICECVQPRDHTVSICDASSTIIDGVDMPYFVDSAGQVDTYPAGRFIRFTPPTSPLSITTQSPLPNGTAGSAYSQQFAAQNGQGTLAWNATGLPAGFSMSSTGLLGAPSPVAGAFQFTVTVQDSTGSANQPFDLTVDPAQLLFAAPSAGALPSGMVGAIWPGVTFTATGGQQPYTWSVLSGATPLGVALHPTSGALAGTPSAAGDNNFTVLVTDALQSRDSRAFTLHVAAVGTGGNSGTAGSSRAGGGCTVGAGTGALLLPLLLLRRRRRK